MTVEKNPPLPLANKSGYNGGDGPCADAFKCECIGLVRDPETGAVIGILSENPDGGPPIETPLETPDANTTFEIVGDPLPDAPVPPTVPGDDPEDTHKQYYTDGVACWSWNGSAWIHDGNQPLPAGCCPALNPKAEPPALDAPAPTTNADGTTNNPVITGDPATGKATHLSFFVGGAWLTCECGGGASGAVTWCNPQTGAEEDLPSGKIVLSSDNGGLVLPWVADAVDACKPTVPNCPIDCSLTVSPKTANGGADIWKLKNGAWGLASIMPTTHKREIRLQHYTNEVTGAAVTGQSFQVDHVFAQDAAAGDTLIACIEQEIENTDCVPWRIIIDARANFQASSIPAGSYFWMMMDQGANNSNISWFGGGVVGVDNNGNTDTFYNMHNNVDYRGQTKLQPGEKANIHLCIKFRKFSYGTQLASVETTPALSYNNFVAHAEVIRCCPQFLPLNQ